MALSGLAIAGVAVAAAFMLPSRLAVFALMLAAAGGLFLYSYEIGAQVPASWKSDAILFSLPKIAMTVVGVAGRTLPAAIARTTLGFVFASVAVQLGAGTIPLSRVPVAVDKSGLLAGKTLASVTATPVAGEGPALVTVMV